MKKLSIANNVRTLRFLNNEMTQKELAQKVGVSRQTIVAIEKRQYSPTLELCFKLSIVFEKSIDEIFTVEKIDGKLVIENEK
ncbi:antitoxin HipB [Candidatus Izimaplasma bacterium HR1]|jgi:putative transcriptional regulator|uniref:helix-turn-helix transcriptional regulator n=1 Tax=Candidatus Izimoplasma sp. HR1 TaxID=1541959 RepID=UPI0004F61213|nr:antitoxin HipB [Candidatus Izimaplasma bacterium HR1]